MKVLKQMREQDKLDHAEYLAAKAMAVEDFLQKTQAKYGALFEQLGSLYDGASAYAKACSDYETAVVTSNYDRQIAAAGNNTKKREKLEKKYQKMRRLYGKDKHGVEHFDVRYIMDSDFKFQPVKQKEEEKQDE